jgi:hypothetical protein
MTVKEMIDAAMKELRVDRRTKAGRELTCQERLAVDRLNNMLWDWSVASEDARKNPAIH